MRDPQICVCELLLVLIACKLADLCRLGMPLAAFIVVSATIAHILGFIRRRVSDSPDASPRLGGNMEIEQCDCWLCVVVVGFLMQAGE